MSEIETMSQPMEMFNWTALLKRDGSMNKVAAHQIEAAKVKQVAILDGYQNAFDHWCARRHQSAESIAELARASLFATGPHDLMTAWAAWSSTAFARLSEDAKEHLSVSSTIARACLPAPLVELPEASNGHDRTPDADPMQPDSKSMAATKATLQ